MSGGLTHPFLVALHLDGRSTILWTLSVVASWLLVVGFDVVKEEKVMAVVLSFLHTGTGTVPTVIVWPASQRRRRGAKRSHLTFYKNERTGEYPHLYEAKNLFQLIRI